MPAVSKKQQRFMGMVHATQKGKMKSPSKAVASAAKSMSKQDATYYASTSHEGLPARKKAAAVALAGVLFKVAGVKEAQGGFWEMIKPYLPYMAAGGLGGLFSGRGISGMLGGAALGGLGGYGIKNWLMPWLKKQMAGQQPPALDQKPVPMTPGGRLPSGDFSMLPPLPGPTPLAAPFTPPLTRGSPSPASIPAPLASPAPAAPVTIPRMSPAQSIRSLRRPVRARPQVGPGAPMLKGGGFYGQMAQGPGAAVTPPVSGPMADAAQTPVGTASPSVLRRAAAQQKKPAAPLNLNMKSPLHRSIGTPGKGVGAGLLRK